MSELEKPDEQSQNIPARTTLGPPSRSDKLRKFLEGDYTPESPEKSISKEEMDTLWNGGNWFCATPFMNKNSDYMRAALAERAKFMNSGELEKIIEKNKARKTLKKADPE